MTDWAIQSVIFCLNTIPEKPNSRNQKYKRALT